MSTTEKARPVDHIGPVTFALQGAVIVLTFTGKHTQTRIEVPASKLQAWALRQFRESFTSTVALESTE